MSGIFGDSWDLPTGPIVVRFGGLPYRILNMNLKNYYGAFG